MGILQARMLSGWLFPSPGDLPNPGTEQAFLHHGQILHSWATIKQSLGKQLAPWVWMKMSDHVSTQDGGTESLPVQAGRRSWCLWEDGKEIICSHLESQRMVHLLRKIWRFASVMPPVVSTESFFFLSLKRGVEGNVTIKLVHELLGGPPVW